MSYILKWLPDKKKLKLELKEYPENIQYYKKYDSFGGNSDSIKYLKKKLKKL